MQYALLTRPQWSGGALATQLTNEPTTGLASEVSQSDPRLIMAPLQQLELLQAHPSQFAALLHAAKPWLILTSPASVHAFGVWAQQQITASTLPNLHHAHLAAVGSGTRDRLHDLLECGLITTQQMDQAICVEDKEKADAHGLLRELTQLAVHESINWAAQSVWLVQGQANRPTLAEGLKAMGATVFVLELYRRIDCDWPGHVLAQLKNAAPGQAAVVLTSTTVVDRAMQLLRTITVDPKAIVWCTQHKAIADRLHQAGAAPLPAIRRVRLDAQYLMKDLFEHEIYW